MTLLVRSISERIAERESLVSSGWLQVWLPTMCPSSAITPSRSLLSLAISPHTKNMACTSYSRRVLRISGVYVGSGPSSKVSTRVRPCPDTRMKGSCRMRVCGCAPCGGGPYPAIGWRR